MKIFMRVIGLGFWGYSFMLTQMNPAQGTAFYLRSTWGEAAMGLFTFWFFASGLFLMVLSMLNAPNRLALFFAGILPQLAYTLIASFYVLSSNLFHQGNAQWGAATTHGFGAGLLLAIIYLYHTGRCHDAQ